jgi:hypothetical protein
MNYKEYTVRIYDSGNKEWFLNGKLHREDGPAREYADGGKYWYLNGKLHRKDGPAAERVNGDKLWYLNDRPHREDGPAREYASGGKFWYLNGKQLTEEEFNKKTNQPSCNDKVVEIDGKKYRLEEVADNNI